MKLKTLPETPYSQEGTTRILGSWENLNWMTRPNHKRLPGRMATLKGVLDDLFFRGGSSPNFDPLTENQTEGGKKIMKKIEIGQTVRVKVETEDGTDVLQGIAWERMEGSKPENDLILVKMLHSYDRWVLADQVV